MSVNAGGGGGGGLKADGEEENRGPAPHPGPNPGGPGGPGQGGGDLRVGTLAWPLADVGVALVSACVNPDVINVTNAGIVGHYNVLGDPKLGIGIAPGIVAAVTDAPSLFMLGVGSVEIPLAGTTMLFGAATRRVLGPNAVEIVYAVSDQEIVARAGGGNNFFALPGNPTAGGLVQLATGAFSVEELVVETDDPSTGTPDDRWIYGVLNGASACAWHFDDAVVSPTVLFQDTDGVDTCTGAVVFEPNTVTVIQNCVDTRTPLIGAYQGWALVLGGIQIDTSAGPQLIPFNPICAGHMHAAAPLNAVGTSQLTLMQDVIDGATAMNMACPAAGPF